VVKGSLCSGIRTKKYTSSSEGGIISYKEPTTRGTPGSLVLTHDRIREWQRSGGRHGGVDGGGNVSSFKVGGGDNGKGWNSWNQKGTKKRKKDSTRSRPLPSLGVERIMRKGMCIGGKRDCERRGYHVQEEKGGIQFTEELRSSSRHQRTGYSGHVRGGNSGGRK